MRRATRRAHQERVLRAQLHLQDRLDSDLPLEALAAVSGYSAFHFHRVFRGLTGESVAEHRRRLRLERAARRLGRGAGSVLEEALDAGYESNEAFSRAFRARFGCSPSEWRAGRGELRPQVPQPPPEGTWEVELVTRPAQPVIFARHVGPYAEVGRAWGRVYAFAGPRGLLAAGPENLGVCHDDPAITPAEFLRYDACLTTAEPLAQTSGDIVAATLPAATYARLEHIGPYDTLGAAHDWLCGVWLVDAGYEPADLPGLEVYRNNPTVTAPADLRTDVLLPLLP